MMQDPRENLNSTSEINYSFQKELMSNVFYAFSTFKKSLSKLYLLSFQNDQEAFEIFCYYGIDKKQIDRNMDLLVLMHQNLLLIKRLMDTLCPREEPLSIPMQLDNHINKLNSDFTLYSSMLENDSSRFQRYNKIIKQIECLQQIAEILLESLKIELVTNFEENSYLVELLHTSFLNFDKLNCDDSEHGMTLLSPSVNAEGEHSTMVRSLPNLESNYYDHNENDGDLFLNFPVEIQLLLISFMPSRDALSLGMTAKYYSDLINDRDLWRGFFKRDFSYHYPALTVFESYVSIDWKNKYKLSKKNPPWPFPLDTQQDAIPPNPVCPVNEAITFGLADSVISNIRQGTIISSSHLKQAVTKRFSPFILELLTTTIKNINDFNFALCFACKNNNCMAVAILIKAGADVNCKIFDKKLKDHLNPFHYALQHGNLFLVKILLDFGAEPIDTKKYPLIYFLLDNYNNSNDLKELDIFFNNDFKQTYEANGRLVSLLEKAINSHALHASSMVKWLLENSANPNTLTSGLDKTPVFYYLISSHNMDIELIKIFLKYKPNLEHRDENGRTAIFYSIYLPSSQLYKNAEVFSLLLDQKVNLTVTDNHGQTVLHFFLRRQNFRNNLDDMGFQFILNCLLNHICINTKDNYGICPLDLAMDNVSALIPMIIMNLLLANTCDKNQENVLHKLAKWSPLGLNNCVKKRMVTIVAFLIKKGADPIKNNMENNSPLQLALDHNNVLVFESLIANGIKMISLRYKKETVSNEIKNAIDCYHYIELAIDLVKNNTSIFSISALTSPIKIDYYMRHASNSSVLLCSYILLNYLSGNELSSKQKERLIDILESCFSFNLLFWKNLAEEITSEDNGIELPPNKIILVLERYLKILEHQQDNISEAYDVEIEKIIEFIEKYKGIRDLAL